VSTPKGARQSGPDLMTGAFLALGDFAAIKPPGTNILLI
jgi:hypothetical protein